MAISAPLSPTILIIITYSKCVLFDTYVEHIEEAFCTHMIINKTLYTKT
jgi:hypothetical protein